MITGYFIQIPLHGIRKSSKSKDILLGYKSKYTFLCLECYTRYSQKRQHNILCAGSFYGKNLLKFFLLNESPLAGHLWYLGAILYVLVIVLLADKFNCRKTLYYLTPVLLIADLVLGKYSLLIFHQEFPYIVVRNFLCVGIPYFCIGNLIREKISSEKWNKKVLRALIVVFATTSLAERFALLNAGLNATRDHYLSTTFLSICLFVYALKSNWCNKRVSVIGRKYSTWLYIIHPILLRSFQ